MGAIWSWLGYPDTGRTDDPDPVTGLTSREKYLVTKTWNVIRQKPTDNGMALLSLYFKKYPDYQNLFPFRNVPFEDLPKNKVYQAHCTAVVYGLSAIIDSMNNTELLVAVLTKTGVSHVPRKVGAQEFLDLKGVTIDLFSTFMKADEVDAWKKTLDVAFGVIIDAVRSKQKQ